MKPFIYAISGLKEALKSQKNLRFHFLAALVVIIIGCIFSISLTEWIILMVVTMAVIACELINTSIEYIVDIICPEQNEKAKIVKDISAAAVFVTAFFAAIIGLLIFFPRLLILISK